MQGELLFFLLTWARRLASRRSPRLDCVCVVRENEGNVVRITLATDIAEPNLTLSGITCVLNYLSISWSKLLLKKGRSFKVLACAPG